MNNVLIISRSTFETNGMINVIKTYTKSSEKYKYHIVSRNINSTQYINDNFDSNVKIFDLHYKSPIKYIKNLNKYIKENNINIVHIHGNSYYSFWEFLFINNNIIKISHFHSMKPKYKVLNRLYKKTFFKTTKNYLVCSKEVGEFYFSNNEFHIIPNLIELGMFKYNSEVRKELRKHYSAKDKIIIGAVGNIHPWKNQMYLVRLLSKLKTMRDDILLIVIGPISNKKYYKKISKNISKHDLSKNIIFLGTKKEIHKYYNMFDYYIIPSKVEGFGLSLLEAQVNGLETFYSSNIPKSVIVSSGNHEFNLDDKQFLWIKDFDFSKRKTLFDVNNKADEYSYSSYNQLKVEEIYNLLIKQTK